MSNCKKTNCQAYDRCSLGKDIQSKQTYLRTGICQPYIPAFMTELDVENKTAKSYPICGLFVVNNEEENPEPEYDKVVKRNGKWVILEEENKE